LDGKEVEPEQETIIDDLGEEIKLTA